jgi:O-antigen/teichoic acid export membrane protein
VLVPNIQEKFSKNENVMDLKGYLHKSNVVYSGVMPILIGLAWFILPPAIELVLPRFTAGIEPLKMLTLSAFFLAAGQSYSHFLVATKKHLVLIPIVVAASLVSAGLSFFVIHSGYDLIGVAASTTTAMLVHFTLVFFAAGRHVFGPKEILMEFAGVVMKFILMLIALMVVDRLSVPDNEIALGIIKYLLFVVLYAPFLVNIAKQFDVLSSLRRKFLGKTA